MTRRNARFDFTDHALRSRAELSADGRREAEIARPLDSGAGRARAALAYLLARHGLDAARVERETDFARKA